MTITPPAAGTSVRILSEAKPGSLAFLTSPMFLAFLAVAAVAIYVFYFKQKLPFFNQ